MVVVPAGDGKHHLVALVNDGAIGRIDEWPRTARNEYFLLVEIQPLRAFDVLAHLHAQGLYAIGSGIVGVPIAIGLDDLVEICLGKWEHLGVKITDGEVGDLLTGCDTFVDLAGYADDLRSYKMFCKLRQLSGRLKG